jgi:hypothetical protein
VESFLEGESLLEGRGAVFEFFDDRGLLCDELTQVAADETETFDLNWLIGFLAILHLAHEIMHAYSKISEKVFLSIIRLFLSLAKFTHIQRIIMFGPILFIYLIYATGIILEDPVIRLEPD